VRRWFHLDEPGVAVTILAAVGLVALGFLPVVLIRAPACRAALLDLFAPPVAPEST